MSQAITLAWRRVLCAKLLQSCLTLCDPMDSSGHGIFPGKNTGVGCHALLQRIFPTQGLNPHLLQLLHWRRILYHWATTRLSCSYLDPRLTKEGVEGRKQCQPSQSYKTRGQSRCCWKKIKWVLGTHKQQIYTMFLEVRQRLTTAEKQEGQGWTNTWASELGFLDFKWQRTRVVIVL